MDRVGSFLYVCPETTMQRRVEVWATYDIHGEAEFVQFLLPNAEPVLRNRDQCNSPLSKAVLEYADGCVIMDEEDDAPATTVSQFIHNNRRYNAVCTGGTAVVTFGQNQVAGPFQIEDAQSPLECAALEALMPYSESIQTRLLAATH